MATHKHGAISIALLGSGAVGKSSITVQYVSKKFLEYYDPTLEDCYERDVVIQDQKYQLVITDTSGQDEYSALLEHAIKDVEGFILVCDVGRRASLDELLVFCKLITRRKERDLANIPITVLLNKCDLPKQQFSEQDARDFMQQVCQASDKYCKYLQTSAALRTNIDEAFATACEQVLLYRKLQTVQLQESQKQQKSTLSSASSSDAKQDVHAFLASQ